jgi:alkyl hydroperoxide reductase subunit AhpC
VGRTAPEFAAEGLNQESLTQKDFQGGVSVLHFWDYRDAPLQEPYGQIGYLDFLAQRRKAEGVKVYGVAVDGRLAEQAQRGQALRGIRKLKSFMNLSYPILLDSGSLIRKFGDPRPAGAELPLFVVIGPDGKIVHYHAGLYEVDRNEGLRELGAAVSKALGK